MSGTSWLSRREHGLLASPCSSEQNSGIGRLRLYAIEKFLMSYPSTARGITFRYLPLRSYTLHVPRKNFSRFPNLSKRLRKRTNLITLNSLFLISNKFCFPPDGETSVNSWRNWYHGIRSSMISSPSRENQNSLTSPVCLKPSESAKAV